MKSEYAAEQEIDSELIRLHRRFQELRQVVDILSDQRALLSDDYEEAFRLLVASEMRYRRLPRHQVLPRLRQLTDKWEDIGREYSQTQIYGLVQGELERAGRKLVSKSPTQPVIFLSYRQDPTGPIARWIAQGLRRRFGAESVFFDTSSIRLGTDYEEKIHQALESASIFLLCIDHAWKLDVREEELEDGKKDWVFHELRTALDWERVIIPLLLNGVRMPAEAVLPTATKGLSRYQGMPLSPDQNFERNPGLLADVIVDRIVELINAGRFPPPASPAVDRQRRG